MLSHIRNNMSKSQKDYYSKTYEIPKNINYQSKNTIGNRESYYQSNYYCQSNYIENNNSSPTFSLSSFK